MTLSVVSGHFLVTAMFAVIVGIDSKYFMNPLDSVLSREYKDHGTVGRAGKKTQIAVMENQNRENKHFK